MNNQLHVNMITLLPEAFPGTLKYSLAGRALSKNIWSYNITNIRDFGIGKYKLIDDTKYGGGDGLVMRPDVIGEAIEYALKDPKFTEEKPVILYPSPRGPVFNQNFAKNIVFTNIRQEKPINIIFLCGRFEGIDERVLQYYNVMNISLGDFILSGGELAAMTILDAIIRLIPGVLKNQNTLKDESFEAKEIALNNKIEAKKLLEYPLYTKPSIWKNKKVPEVLISGHHGEIKKWQIQESIKITKKIRPDLL